MQAEVGDTGSGLVAIFAAGGGNSSNFTHSPFQPGHMLSHGTLEVRLR